MKTRTKVALAAPVVAGLIGGLGLGTVLNSAPAHATTNSDVAYLQALTDSGFRIYDTAWAIQTGHQVCADLNHMDGNQAAHKLYATSSVADVPSLAVAQTWVIDSVFTLCPWQYHPDTPNYPSA